MSLLNKIHAIINNSNSQVTACLQLTDEMIENIFQEGVNHGLFEEKNYGLHDRKNSVYGLIGTLTELKKIN